MLSKIYLAYQYSATLATSFIFCNIFEYLLLCKIHLAYQYSAPFAKFGIPATFTIFHALQNPQNMSIFCNICSILEFRHHQQHLMFCKIQKTSISCNICNILKSLKHLQYLIFFKIHNTYQYSATFPTFWNLCNIQYIWCSAKPT